MLWVITGEIEQEDATSGMTADDNPENDMKVELNIF